MEVKRLKMKLFAGLTAVLASVLGCTRTSPAKSEDAPMSKAASSTLISASGPKNEGANELAWDMYRAIGATGDNVFISPASISTAIGLAFEGSSGETRAKARKFLALSPGGENESLVPSVRRSFDESGPSIKLLIHNAVWADPVGIDPTPEYVQRAEKLYSAKVAKKSFGDGEKLSEEINAWVKQATTGMIDKIVSPGDLKGQHLAILNAVYFLGTWQEPFDASRTLEEDFVSDSGSKTKTLLMNQTEFFSYADVGAYKIIHVPYKNPDYVMSIILPKAGTKLADLEKKLKAASFENEGGQERVWLKLPKCKIDWGVKNVVAELEALGLPMSGPQADFKIFGAKDTIYISSVLHRAVVKVDEKGTEAAAATAVMMRAGSAPSQPATFHCDRPFVFVIRDKKRNEILFIGRLTKP